MSDKAFNQQRFRSNWNKNCSVTKATTIHHHHHRNNRNNRNRNRNRKHSRSKNSYNSSNRSYYSYSRSRSRSIDRDSERSNRSRSPKRRRKYPISPKPAQAKTVRYRDYEQRYHYKPTLKSMKHNESHINGNTFKLSRNNSLYDMNRDKVDERAPGNGHYCEECETSQMIHQMMRCIQCEQLLCERCEWKLHQKGARKRHNRYRITTNSDPTKPVQRMCNDKMRYDWCNMNVQKRNDDQKARKSHRIPNNRVVLKPIKSPKRYNEGDSGSIRQVISPPIPLMPRIPYKECPGAPKSPDVDSISSEMKWWVSPRSPVLE